MMPGMAPDPDPDEVPSPLDYPGRRLQRSALLRHDRLVDWAVGALPMDQLLSDLGVAPLDARALVLGVGSNADPRQVVRKLRAAGAGTVVPFATCTVAGIAVTHSAHVSAGGYVPMAPAAHPGAEVALVAAYVDPEQLAALDATEPNYQRLLLDGARYALRLDGGVRPASYHVYRSRHGVLRPDGELLPPLGQPELHERLFRGSDLAAVVTGATAEERVAALGLPDVQQRVRECFGALGWVAGSGLRGEPAGA